MRRLVWAVLIAVAGLGLILLFVLPGRQLLDQRLIRILRREADVAGIAARCKAARAWSGRRPKANRK